MTGVVPLVRAALCGFGPLLLAAMLTGVVAALDSSSFADVVLLPPETTSFARDAVAILATGFAMFAFNFAPGVLASRAAGVAWGSAAAGVVGSFVLTQFLLAAGWAGAMALFPGEGSRTCAYLTVGAVCGLALLVAVFRTPGAGLLALREGKTLDRRSLLVTAVAILVLFVVTFLVFPGKLRVEALEGDATEVLGFGSSLFQYAVPRWDLESGAWGFYPTFVFIGYPVLFHLASIGVCEAAVRLPGLVSLAVLLFVVVDLAGSPVGGAARSPLRRHLPAVLLAGFMSLLVGAHYAGYHPFHGDWGCSPLEEWMVTSFALGALLLLRDGHSALAALAALLSILTFPSGLMFVGLLGLGAVVFANADERRTTLRALLILLVGVALVAVGIAALTLSEGTFHSMLGEWNAKYFEGRAGFTRESPERVVQAWGWFTLLCGGAALLGFATAWRSSDRWARVFAFAGLLWVLFFSLSPAKNIHYFMPAALLPIMAALRTGLSPALLSLSAALCIGLVWPTRVPPYTVDREFGRESAFLAPTIREAVEDSQLLYNFAKPLWKWQKGDDWTIGHHTWVLYARHPQALGPRGQTAHSIGGESRRPLPRFVVGRTSAPDTSFIEITRRPVPGGTAVLWSRAGREDWREYRDRDFPRKRDLSRFHFDMGPGDLPGPGSKPVR